MSENFYQRIFQSSALVGGAEGVSLVVGLVRTKLAALLVGPIGLGILGNFSSVQGLVSVVSGMGVRASAVRDIAQAVHSGNSETLCRVVTTVRRICFATGILGLLLTFLLSRVLSYWTFGDDSYSFEIQSLGLAIFLASLTGGEAAILQGHGRIADLAKLKIITALSATGLTVVLYGLFGINGIILAIVALAGVEFFATRIYTAAIGSYSTDMSWIDAAKAGKQMLVLGLAFMWSGLVFSLVGWVTRGLITQDHGLQAVGVFGAAYALSALAINFVTTAIATDFYPRLSALTAAPNEANKLVNQQVEVGLLLGLPGLLILIAFAPWIIVTLYSKEFLPAAHLMQMLAAGCVGRLMGWPLKHLMPAMASTKLLILFETAVNGAHLFLIYIGLAWFGLEGVAYAFLALQPLYLVGAYLSARRLTNFTWSLEAVRVLCLAVLMTGLTFWASSVLQGGIAVVTGGTLVTCSALVCLRWLVSRVGRENRLVRAVLQIRMARLVCGVN